MFFSNLLLFLIDFVTGVVEFLIGLRLVLKLFGASTQAPFVVWVYETTAPLLSPFQGMFPNPVLTDGLILEFSALFALIAYALLSYLLSTLIREVEYLSRRRR